MSEALCRHPPAAFPELVVRTAALRL